MIHTNLSVLSRSSERKLVTGVALFDEGVALVATYENGELRVKPSTGAPGEIFAGVAISQRQVLRTLPNIEVVTTDAEGNVTLAFTPVPGTTKVNGLVEAAELATGKFVLTGNVVATSTPDTVYTISYTYSPSSVQALSIQGDVLPGQALAGIVGSTTVIESGEVYTSSFDTTCDWSNPTTLRLGANGKFTTSGTGSVVKCLVTKAPVAGAPTLGLSFNI